MLILQFLLKITKIIMKFKKIDKICCLKKKKISTNRIFLILGIEL